MRQPYRGRDDHGKSSGAGPSVGLEQDLQERGYAAVERLLANVAGREGKLDERVVSLPHPAGARALCELYEAGWVYDAS
jgi:hypothetical protein